MFKVIKCEEGKKFCSKSLQEAEIYDTIGTYDNEAFLLPKDVIVVDIDDVEPDVIEALLDEFNIKTMYSHTDEGAHLYFKKPTRYKKANSGTSPLGLHIEHKHKQCVITYNGITRELINEGTLEDLPFILTIDDKYPNLYGLDDGDGRYDKLLSMNGFLGKRANKRQILTFINMYVFENPIKGSKLNSIINSELDYGDFEDEDKSKKDVKEDTLRELLEIYKPVYYNNEFYFWDPEDEMWETNKQVLTRLLYHKFFGFSTSAIDEYQKQIERLAFIYKDFQMFPIQFVNGYLLDGEWHHGIYEGFTPYMIKYSYLPNKPQTPEMETFLNFITRNDQTLITYLFEAFSQVFEVDPNMRNKYPRIHTFLGEGGNGKGMLMRTLKRAVGKHNASSVKLHKFNDKDDVVTLRGKLINISEDENGTLLTDAMLANVKNIAAADEITIRKIYSEADSNTLIFPALFVTSNHPFPTREKGESVKRRFFWIEFNEELGGQSFMNDDFVRALESDDSMEWFISQMVQGYFNVRKNGFSKCKVIDDFTAEYHSINNNIEEYAEDLIIQDFEGKVVAECYNEYEAWAESERKYAMPMKDFKLFICKKYRMEEVVGKIPMEMVAEDGSSYIKRVSKRKFRKRD